jgi:hypothetical protein
MSILNIQNGSYTSNNSVTKAISISGGIAATSVTLKMTKIGNIVMINIPAFSAAATSAATMTAAAASIPAIFCPSSDSYFPLYVIDDITKSWGILKIDSDGSIIISKAAGAVFTTGVANGIYNNHITYTTS